MKLETLLNGRWIKYKEEMPVEYAREKSLFNDLIEQLKKEFL